MVRTYIGTLEKMGLGLIDLGVPGEDVHRFFASIRELYGPLPPSARFEVSIDDRGEIIDHKIVRRGRGTNVFGVVPESAGERRSAPMSPEAWRLILSHQHFPARMAAGKLRGYVRIIGLDETLWVLQRELQLRAAAYDETCDLPFEVYCMQAMTSAMKRAVERRQRESGRPVLEDAEDYSQCGRTVYGGGRQRELDPAIAAELYEEYPEYAAACC